MVKTLLKPVIEQLVASQVNLPSSPLGSLSTLRSSSSESPTKPPSPVNSSFSTSISVTSSSLNLAEQPIFEVIKVQAIQLDNHLPLITAKDDLKTTSVWSTSSPPSYSYRLELADGVNKIVAVLHSNLHAMAAVGDIFPGAVVKLGKFTFRRAPRKISKGRARSDPSGPEGGEVLGSSILYLAVEELDVVGDLSAGDSVFSTWSAVAEADEVEDEEGGGVHGKERESGRREYSSKMLRNPAKSNLNVNPAPQRSNMSTPPPRTTIPTPVSVIGKRFLQNISESATDSPRPKKRPHAFNNAPGSELTTRDPPHITQLKSKSDSEVNVLAQPHLRSVPRLLAKELKIVKLADLHMKPHGSKVDVLGIVESIDPKTTTRSIGIKRDCRLIDDTSKTPTILSVWVDAEKFLPPAGSLVAFRGLTVHRWSGRSLNAYTDLLGTVWYQENPEQVEGAEELKEWYEDKLLLEAAEGFPGLEASQEAERV